MDKRKEVSHHRGSFYDANGILKIGIKNGYFKLKLFPQKVTILFKMSSGSPPLRGPPSRTQPADYSPPYRHRYPALHRQNTGGG